MNYAEMYMALRKILSKEEQIDYAMGSKMAAAIQLWSMMYSGMPPWMNETIKDAGIPAAVAGEIARLTTLEMKSTVEGSERAEYIDSIYKSILNNLRVQTEYALAKGGMVFKPYVTSSGIAIQYLQADCFFPLEFDSERITKCAFIDQYRSGGQIYTRVELHSIKGDMLQIQNRAFVSRTDGVLGTELPITEVDKWSGLAEEASFTGSDKLLFGYFKVPLGNTKEATSPLGVSVYAKAVERIRDADETYSQIDWEYKAKEAAVHISQSLLKQKDAGEYEYPGGQDRLYRALDYNMGATDKPLIDVFSPEIRDESFFNAWNNRLRLIEFECNLAYGTLSDPNNTDKTAEEIKASKQRSYSFIETCQTALQTALEDTVDAIAFWCSIYNLCPEGSYNVSFVWDDSIVVDTEKERTTDRADVAMGAMQLWEYRAKWYGETEEQAKAAVQQVAEVIE